MASVFSVGQRCAMMKARSGRIISISSVVGVTEIRPNKCGIKGGMIRFSKSLAAEVAVGALPSMLAPGFIATPMTDVLDVTRKWRFWRVPTGRLGTAAEIAASVVFLASDEAAYITGTRYKWRNGYAVKNVLAINSHNGWCKIKKIYAVCRPSKFSGQFSVKI